MPRIAVRGISTEFLQTSWFDGSDVPDAMSSFETDRCRGAEEYYRQALELHPNDPLAHNNLGWTRQMQGDGEGALTSYREALRLDSGARIARRNLAMLLVRLGRRDESFPLWYQEMLTGSEGLNWMQHIISIAMRAQDLTLASEYAEILVQLRRASAWYPRRLDGLKLPVQRPGRFLTIPKLRHDIEQFKYLQHRSVLGGEFTAIIKQYERTMDRLILRGIPQRVPLTSKDRHTIGHVYNQVVHLRNTPRVQGQLWGAWAPAAVERKYLRMPLGLAVVDNFLSREALESIRLFCLESTVWSANHYAHGRLGAFFHDGFNCPLLIQIAEELRRLLPHIILDRYPLRQLWGFKNTEHLPADSTIHADFAAVNVNLWITPEEANLDRTSGGLVIYDVDAPLTWDFATYNGRTDIINPYLQQQQARFVYIPYRQNRAVIFNSDLFHASAKVRFRPGYENRRINITMLYGDRERDVQHANVVGLRLTVGRQLPSIAWRSIALSRVRTGYRSL